MSAETVGMLIYKKLNVICMENTNICWKLDETCSE